MSWWRCGSCDKAPGMDFDGLGEIERDALAPWQEHLFDELEDHRVHHKPLDRCRTHQQRAKALGAFAVERALTQRRCREASVEIRFDACDDRRLDSASEHASAVARQHGGVPIDRGVHADTCSVTSW